jgi:catechol 2,3-dioxygenase-like lactoylglutathione lyase family enzyme
MAAFEGIAHIDVVVDDPEKMTEFLFALGFEMVRRAPANRGSIEIRFPGGDKQPILELTPSESPNGKGFPPGLRHIAIRAKDLEATHTELLAKGYKFSGPIRDIEDTGRRLVNLVDPEGKTLQIVSA